MTLIEDWKSACRWFSVRTLAAIAVLPLVSPMIPADVQAWLPGTYRPWVLVALALGGIAGRLIDQKPVG